MIEDMNEGNDDVANLPDGLNWIWADFNTIGLTHDPANADCIYSLHRKVLAGFLTDGFIPINGPSEPVFVYDIEDEVDGITTVLGELCTLERNSEGRSPVIARPVHRVLYYGELKPGLR